jgi:hypothetical protein
MSEYLNIIHTYSAAFFASDITKVGLAIIFVMCAYFVANIDGDKNV